MVCRRDIGPFIQELGILTQFVRLLWLKGGSRLKADGAGFQTTLCVVADIVYGRGIF